MPPLRLPHLRRLPTPLHNSPASSLPRRVSGRFPNALLTAFFLSSLALCGTAIAQSESSEPSPERTGFDLLSGNGGTLYHLSHGGVTDKSLSVRAGGQPLRLGQDYFFNPSNGMLTLVQPLDAGASLSVRYRYNSQADGSGKPLGFSYVPGFTGGLNLVYAATPGELSLGAGNGSQVSGLMLSPRKVGAGSFSGMTLLSSGGSNPFSALKQSRDGRANLVSQLAGGGTKEAGSGDLNQYSLDGLKAGNATFGLNYRKVGKDFDFSPLASQFQDGPQKALFDQLQKERGLSTLGFAGDMKLGTSAKSLMRFTQVSDEMGSASQQSLGYTGKTLDVSVSRLKVSSGFTHLKEADLQDVRDLQAGQDRSDLLLNLHPSDKFSLRSSLTRLKSESGDSQTLTRHALELKPGKDTKLAFSSQQIKLRLAEGEGDASSDQKFNLITRALDLNYRSVKIGSRFTDAKQAGFTEEQDLKELLPGQQRTEFGANLHPSKTLNLQTGVMRVKAENGEAQTVKKQSAEFKPGKNTKIAFSKQQALAKLADNVAQTKNEIKQSISLNHQTKGLLVQANQDSLTQDDPNNAVRQRNQLFKFELGQKNPTLFLFEKKLDANGTLNAKTNRQMTFSTRFTRLAAIQFSETSLEVKENESLRTAYERKLRIETEAKNPLKLVFDKQDERKEDGASKVAQQISLTAKPSPTSEVTVSDTDFAQKEGETTVSGNNLEFSAKPTPAVTLSGNFMDREDSAQGDTDEMNLKLQGKAGKADLQAEHNTSEVENEEQKVIENALALTAPVGDKTNVKGTYLDRKNKGKSEKSVRSVGFDRGMLGGRLLLELGKTRYLQGHPFSTYAAGFTSAQDPKQSLRFVTLYRKMGSADGAEASQYQYGVDWRINPKFSFSVKSYQNDSVRDGYFYRITPVRGHGFSLDAQLNPRLKFTGGFDHEEDLNAHTMTSTRNLSLKGNIDDETTVDLSYVARMVPTWKEETPTHWWKVAMKRDLSDEDRLVLTGEGKYWKDTDQNTTDKQLVNARLDFVRVF